MQVAHFLHVLHELKRYVKGAALKLIVYMTAL